MTISVADEYGTAINSETGCVGITFESFYPSYCCPGHQKFCKLWNDSTDQVILVVRLLHFLGKISSFPFTRN
ncbi:hypothetical protein Y032_0022g472 [Ancylostoma ceylanicum]|uniref:Uncharacterized protein n=1 Tax=Ancylostoma ceylanicum TaxID=53326 RepID=A0A016UXL9_9BILA|nr:hypothetical protein Y032_0022g472 [Ancylostoma ceylanicum]